MKVSIIVPVYNVEKYLPKCLDSILAQTFEDFELLLIDDGSSDTSGAICDEYASRDSRVRVFHKENGGPSAARNVGLDNARGEWIAFVDSDDTVKPHYLKTFIDVQQKYNADLVVTGIDSITVRVERHLLIDRSFKREEMHEFARIASEMGVISVPWNKLFSAAKIREHKLTFDETLWCSEDWVFVVDFLQFIDCAAMSSAVTYNHYAREEISLSKRYVPLDMLYKAADMLYDLGSVLSKEPSYIEHLKRNYAYHLSRNVMCLYWLHCHFSRKQRLHELESLVHQAKKKGVESYFFQQLREDHKIYFQNIEMIDLYKMARRFGSRVKLFLKDHLPNDLNNRLKRTKDRCDGETFIELADFDESV